MGKNRLSKIQDTCNNKETITHNKRIKDVKAYLTIEVLHLLAQKQDSNIIFIVQNLKNLAFIII